MNLTVFDKNKLDYEARRKEHRKRLLKKTIIPSVILVLLAGWLIIPYVVTSKTIELYEDANYQAAIAWQSPLRPGSPERFVYYFNTGTIFAQLNRFDESETHLNKALSMAPDDKICMVAENISALHGMRIKSLQDQNKATEAYEAKQVEIRKEYPDCFKGSAASGGGGGSSSSNASQNELNEAQQESLKQKEEAGMQRKEALAQEEKYDPSKPELKPW